MFKFENNFAEINISTSNKNSISYALIVSKNTKKLLFTAYLKSGTTYTSTSVPILVLLNAARSAGINIARLEKTKNR